MKPTSPRMYQPTSRPDQIRALYFLKIRQGTSMTCLLQEAVDRFLVPFGGSAGLIPAGRGMPPQSRSAGSELPGRPDSVACPPGRASDSPTLTLEAGARPLGSVRRS